MGYVMKALRATGRLINELAREEERSLRAQQRELKEKIRAEKQALKLQEKLERLQERARKEKAEYCGYIFEKDEKSKRSNKSRMQGYLKDYVFWQFFALEDDIKEATPDIQEYVKQIDLGYSGKAEWREEK